MFRFSKFSWTLIEPLNESFLICCLFTLGLWIKPLRGWARKGLTIFCAIVFIFIWIPIDKAILTPLENRFADGAGLPDTVTGILTLSGAVNLQTSQYRQRLSLDDQSERLTEFVLLAGQYPTAKLCYSGGNAQEAELIKKYLTRFGRRPDRMIFETTSQNTFENVTFSKRLVDPSAAENWILVTSAAHMPRAMGVFNKVGWRRISPYAVDHQTDDNNSLLQPENLGLRVRRFSIGLKEWLGLLYYRLMGYSDQFFPAPLEPKTEPETPSADSTPP